MMNLFIQWFGSATGVLGALLLATNTSISAYGWLLFALSNMSWITFAASERITSMLLMQIVFLFTSVVGIIRWLL